ncbi:PIN domain-containing protein [Georgenia subflava]|uniref:Ribonuclease VapC n=1 Tax=Georgenia subflava TaxID=1622177 RepID=A0A6N7ENL1_9MICO|nr:PIN domain-containing protein [Georgenia subflava]MPV38683.1 PIN domain-containing protein [Georgenia subflava]
MTAGITCDTSVLVPALISWHREHEAARHAIAGGVDVVPAHVVIESYSVLTRLPAPHRISPEDAANVLSRLAVRAVGVPDSTYRALVTELGRSRLTGGAAYDALVAVTARHHRLRLLTRDRRARGTYDSVGVEYTML